MLSFLFPGSTLGKFTNVSVSNCRTSDEKCILKRGNNATISIKFIPNMDISSVDVLVYGVMLDIPIPFPIEKPDACEDPDSGIHCPLKKNQEYYYTTTMFVQRKFPSVSVDIKWELVNTDKQKIVCILFPAKVATFLR
ncbi:Protein NPC2-like protein [Harpegnathos saltator]|uniref:Protein NPC2-like protein n=1 Tax=Harpegnathos saltator TaxID=610380 RepID=E2B469_HARSA|nr:Protein NPC2-like protein [Harpegnathos saltator]